MIMSARLSRDPPEILGVTAAAANGGFRRHVVDVHYYNLYSDTFDHMTLEDNIRYVRDKRPAEMGGMQRADGPPVLVGEWANKPRGGASGDDYGRFAQAQLDVFCARPSVGVLDLQERRRRRPGLEPQRNDAARHCFLYLTELSSS